MIVHICGTHAWAEAQRAGEYRPASLESEGFVHASQPEQALQVANRFYAGQVDLLLLWIDPQHLRASIRYEPADGELFPHIYGAVNLDAVRSILAFPADADGVYRRLPGAGGELSQQNSLS
jgi:uncharacterized protein (DUF952 family)